MTYELVTYELDDKSDREKIIDIGISHIQAKLGDKKGELISWNTVGEELLYEMGVLACMGIEGEELMAQELDLLNKAKAVIQQNRQDGRNIDSGP